MVFVALKLVHRIILQPLVFASKLLYPKSMKSLPRSVGNIFLIAWSVGLMACGMMGRSGPGPSSGQWGGRGESQALEVSISEDQRKIEELRKNIPPEVRRENDALREILNLLGEVRHPPQQHRNRFNRTMRNMRQAHQREMRRERDQFNQEERQSRDRFLADLRKEREDFSKKRDVEERERNHFFKDQDRRRNEYFANERDKRNIFESDQRERERDFDAVYREKTNEFNREYNIYVQRYNEMQAELREKRRREAEERRNPRPSSSQDYEPLEAGQ